jgi:hypothetical protein
MLIAIIQMSVDDLLSNFRMHFLPPQHTYTLAYSWQSYETTLTLRVCKLIETLISRLDEFSISRVGIYFVAHTSFSSKTLKLIST